MRGAIEAGGAGEDPLVPIGMRVGTQAKRALRQLQAALRISGVAQSEGVQRQRIGAAAAQAQRLLAILDGPLMLSPQQGDHAANAESIEIIGIRSKRGVDEPSWSRIPTVSTGPRSFIPWPNQAKRTCGVWP